MRSPRLPVLVPVLMALAFAPLHAEETPATGTPPVVPPPGQTPSGQAPGGTAPSALTPEQEKFWKDYESNPQTSQAEVQSDALYVNALAEYQAAHFVEARDLIEQSIRINPANEKAQKLRQDILALLSVRENRLQMAAQWFHSMEDVKTQELAVRLAGFMASGDRKMAQHDYVGAELDYDRVDVGLRSFPYQFDWGGLPAEVQRKKLQARAEARQVEVRREEDMRDAAARAASNQANILEIALKDKVDELLRRAHNSYDRQDYRRAEVDAWNAYELDRRREDARKLYLEARRGGHVQFDTLYREERLETLARVQEEIHRSLIPQNEILVYPEDWRIRAMRKPQQIGTSTVEPWMAELKERLEQRVTFDFSERPLDEVLNILHQVSGVTFVIAPDVGGAAAPNVTLKVKDMRLADAMKWILEQTGLKMSEQNQAIFISKAGASGAIVLRLYDVTDLVTPVRDFPGRQLAFHQNKGGKGIDLFKNNTPDDNKAPDPDALIDFIKKNVAPNDWAGDDVGIEQRSGSTLFVSQTPEVHALIEQLLASMRDQQSLQVHVGVKMVDVSKDFFEEIGMEYTDTTAANGNAGPGQTSLPYPMLLTSQPATPIAAAGVGVPAGGAVAGNNGYVRLNDTIAYNGSLVQNMPANASDSAQSNATPRGLEIQGALHPFSFLAQDQVNAIFSAFEQETDSQVLEHPELTCFNGQRASATFIHQYAYIASYDIVNYTYEPEIAVLNFGDIIDVRPVISSDRKYITMEVRPVAVKPVQFFVMDIVAPRIGSSGNFLIVYGFFDYPLELPNVKITTLASTVLMPDRGTLLLGGFSNALRQRTHSGVPFLSHIPFLGRLFSRDGTYDQDDRIFFMLHAEIIDMAEKEKLQ